MTEDMNTIIRSRFGRMAGQQQPARRTDEKSDEKELLGLRNEWRVALDTSRELTSPIKRLVAEVEYLQKPQLGNLAKYIGIR